MHKEIKVRVGSLGTTYVPIVGRVIFGLNLSRSISIDTKQPSSLLARRSTYQRLDELDTKKKKDDSSNSYFREAKPIRILFSNL